MGRHLKRFHPAIWRSIFDQPEENKDDEEEEEVEDGNDEDYEDHAEAEAAGGDDDEEEEDDVPKGKSIQAREFFKLLRVCELAILLQSRDIK